MYNDFFEYQGRKIPLFLAPMEGVGDRALRKAMSLIGGFDWTCTEFIRVPINAHVKSLAKVYEHDLTAPFPQAAQLMGENPELMAEMAIEIEKRKAPRIDLNCGCPSNTVTGKGAGSSLLKTPDRLYQIAKALVQAVKIPVSAKLRSGFSDTSLFEENLLAAQESGIQFLTLHPRTKEDGYKNPARWDLIAKAKEILKIPVVGNGDIYTVEDAKRMLEITGCDGIMIGRGALINPFIFHEIKAHFSSQTFAIDSECLKKFLTSFITYFPEDLSQRCRMNKLKQLFSFLFMKNRPLQEEKTKMLTTQYVSIEEFLNINLNILIQKFI